MSWESTGKGDFLWLVAIVVVLGVLWFATGGLQDGGNRSLFLNRPYEPASRETERASFRDRTYLNRSTNADPELNPEFYSPWSEKVELGRGNAASEYRPGFEYITITSRANEPVTITNWQLASSRSASWISGSAYIPYGKKLFIGGEDNWPVEPIVLDSRGKAIVVTGRLPERNPYPISTSFQVNRCSGYLGELKHYQDKFKPALRGSCPNPETEVDLNLLDDKCYDFVRRLGRCELPEEKEVDDELYFGGLKDVPRACREFVTEVFNYNACVLRHHADPDFYTDEWRVYLGQSWELWDDSRETITLYDQNGKIVDQLSY